LSHSSSDSASRSPNRENLVQPCDDVSEIKGRIKAERVRHVSFKASICKHLRRIYWHLAMYRYHASIQHIRMTYRVPNDNVQPAQLLMRAPDELLALRDDAAVLPEVNRPRTPDQVLML
jgi:hypothetical protein